MGFSISKYENLPETLSSSELSPLFVEMLDYAKNGNISIKSILIAFQELADRQWHTYELIDKEIGNKIQTWIINNTKPDIDQDLLEGFIMVIGYLGLSKALEHLSQIALSVKNPVVRNEIYESIEELKPNIDDPYSGMRNL